MKGKGMYRGRDAKPASKGAREQGSNEATKDEEKRVGKKTKRQVSKTWLVYLSCFKKTIANKNRDHGYNIPCVGVLGAFVLLFFEEVFAWNCSLFVQRGL